MGKKILLSSIILLAVLVNLVNVNAITGSLGNSKMILHMEPGESQEKFLLVKNINDYPITVDVSISGDLAKRLVLQDESFSLEAGQEKKVYFTITAGKVGSSEARLNVRFTPPEGNGVGLTSVITVVSEGDDSWLSLEDDGESEIEDSEENQGFSFNPNGVPEQFEEKLKRNSGLLSFAKILIYLTGLLVVSFVVVLIFYFKSGKKKGSRGKGA